MPALSAAELAALHQAHEVLLGQGLAVLAAWALLNLVGSGSLLARADRRTTVYYFHGMNVGWGLVNAGLAAWGIWHQHPAAPKGLRLADLLQAQLTDESLFALNVGLDVAYIVAGFYLCALAGSASHRPVRLLGFGRALWVQGGFLLVFDAVMWYLLHGQGNEWVPFLP